jgi:cytochrome P450
MNVVDFEIPPAPPGEFLLMDEPQHGRYRKPLVGKFTVRRMRLLTERIEQITTECLDAMEKAGPPTDLVTAFAKPIPTVIICELLGCRTRTGAPSRSRSTPSWAGRRTTKR